MPSGSWEFADAAAHGSDQGSTGLDAMLASARECDSQGKLLESLHLYLAAYEAALEEFQGSFLFEGHPALDGLRRAWEISCTLEDHNLAAHILEALEPYLTLEELRDKSERVESMALAGLAHGSSALTDFDGVASAVAKDLVEAIRKGAAKGPGSALANHGDASVSMNEQTDDAASRNPLGPGSCGIDDLHGFDPQLEQLLKRGVFTRGDDDGFLEQMLLQHGVDSLPSRPPLVFRASAREDANKLMLAVAAELHAPTIRMRVDDSGYSGSVMSLIASNGYDPRAAWAANGLGLPDVLVLEDIDTWVTPGVSYAASSEEELQGGMTKGAFRALALIHAAIENPHVTVFASMQAEYMASPFTDMILGPVDYFDIEDPDDDSRDAIWDHMMDAHPSLSALDRFELVRLSAGMCRCDIEAAAHEAVSQAFESSIASHSYQPVTRSNILDTIAAYQPLDSKEYREIEDSLAEDLMAGIDDFLESLS